MKKISLTIFVLLLLPGLVFAQTTLYTHNNSPLTEYQKLLFVPRAELDGGLGSDCSAEGTIYVNRDKESRIYFCMNNGTNKTWSLLSGLWKQSGNIISLQDNLTPENKKVGIGTDPNPPPFKLSLENDGGIFAQGTYNPANASLASMPLLDPGLYFIWYPKKAALWVGEFNSGYFGSNGPQDYQIGDFSVSLGSNNLSSGLGSGILSGASNVIRIGANYSVIVSGQSNTIADDSQYSIIAAGNNNQITGNHGFIGGCGNCDLTGDFLTVLSGSNNDIDGLSSHSFIGSGQDNAIHGFNDSMGAAQDDANVISSGHINIIYGGYNVIASGQDNTIGQSTDTSPTAYSFIGSGAANQLYSSYSTVGGGYSNWCLTKTAPYKTFGGGANNEASGKYATIGGGDNNTTGTGSSLTIVGGSNNTITNSATAEYSSFISGSYNSILSGVFSYSGIMGGDHNSIVSGTASIHGGKNITIGTGDHSYTTTGSELVTTNGTYGWIIGTNLNFPVVFNNGFLWGHYPSLTNISTNASTYSNNFIIATGAVGIGTLSPDDKLHVNGNMRISTGSLSITVPRDLEGSPMNRNTVTGAIGLDLAERFLSTEAVEPGDVMVIGDNSLLLKSAAPYDKRVIGIVSHSPGALLDGARMQFSPGGIKFEKGDRPPIALAGRVIIKVTLENGAIEAGDFLTSSSLPGHAMRAEHSNGAAHTIVAKSLESFEGGPEGQTTGLIEAIVTLR